jgi:hypothetical protein
MNQLLRGLLSVTLWLGCSSLAAAGDGLLIITVDLMRLNNIEGQTDTIEPITAYSLVNLSTKHSYRFNMYRSVDAEGIEEGIYCLSSASFFSTEVPYCGEPYFKVVAGKVNNAGWWRLGYSIGSPSKLIFVPHDSTP